MTEIANKIKAQLLDMPEMKLFAEPKLLNFVVPSSAMQKDAASIVAHIESAIEIVEASSNENGHLSPLKVQIIIVDNDGNVQSVETVQLRAKILDKTATKETFAGLGANNDTCDVKRTCYDAAPLSKVIAKLLAAANKAAEKASEPSQKWNMEQIEAVLDQSANELPDDRIGTFVFLPDDTNNFSGLSANENAIYLALSEGAPEFPLGFGSNNVGDDAQKVLASATSHSVCEQTKIFNSLFGGIAQVNGGKATLFATRNFSETSIPWQLAVRNKPCSLEALDELVGRDPTDAMKKGLALIDPDTGDIEEMDPSEKIGELGAIYDALADVGETGDRRAVVKAVALYIEHGKNVEVFKNYMIRMEPTAAEIVAAIEMAKTSGFKPEETLTLLAPAIERLAAMDGEAQRAEMLKLAVQIVKSFEKTFENNLGILPPFINAVLGALKDENTKKLVAKALVEAISHIEEKNFGSLADKSAEPIEKTIAESIFVLEDHKLIGSDEAFTLVDTLCKLTSPAVMAAMSKTPPVLVIEWFWKMLDEKRKEEIIPRLAQAAAEMNESSFDTSDRISDIAVGTFGTAPSVNRPFMEIWQKMLGSAGMAAVAVAMSKAPKSGRNPLISLYALCHYAMVGATQKERLAFIEHVLENCNSFEKVAVIILAALRDTDTENWLFSNKERQQIIGLLADKVSARIALIDKLPLIGPITQDSKEMIVYRLLRGMADEDVSALLAFAPQINGPMNGFVRNLTYKIDLDMFDTKDSVATQLEDWLGMVQFNKTGRSKWPTKDFVRTYIHNSTGTVKAPLKQVTAIELFHLTEKSFNDLHKLMMMYATKLDYEHTDIASNDLTVWALRDKLLADATTLYNDRTLGDTVENGIYEIIDETNGIGFADMKIDEGNINGLRSLYIGNDYISQLIAFMPEERRVRIFKHIAEEYRNAVEHASASRDLGFISTLMENVSRKIKTMEEAKTAIEFLALIAPKLNVTISSGDNGFQGLAYGVFNVIESMETPQKLELLKMLLNAAPMAVLNNIEVIQKIIDTKNAGSKDFDKETAREIGKIMVGLKQTWMIPSIVPSLMVKKSFDKTDWITEVEEAFSLEVITGMLKEFYNGEDHNMTEAELIDTLVNTSNLMLQGLNKNNSQLFALYSEIARNAPLKALEAALLPFKQAMQQNDPKSIALKIFVISKFAEMVDSLLKTDGLSEDKQQYLKKLFRLAAETSIEENVQLDCTIGDKAIPGCKPDLFLEQCRKIMNSTK